MESLMFVSVRRATLLFMTMVGHCAFAAVQIGEHYVLESKTCGYREVLTSDVQGTASATTTTTTTTTTTSGTSLCARGSAQVKIISEADGKGVVTVSFRQLGGNGDEEPGFVSKGILYSVPQATIEQSDHHSWGLTTGVLAIPMKVVKGSIEPGGSLGPYIGYRLAALDANVQGVLSGGLSVNKNSTDSSTDSSKTKAGVFVAAGVVFEILGKTQLGVLLGTDYSPGYVYNKKLWISFSIGGEFTK